MDWIDRVLLDNDDGFFVLQVKTDSESGDSEKRTYRVATETLAALDASLEPFRAYLAERDAARSEYDQRVAAGGRLVRTPEGRAIWATDDECVLDDPKNADGEAVLDWADVAYKRERESR